MSTDTYHPKTVWMTQGATHLRCSSGAEIKVAEGGTLTIGNNATVSISSGVNYTDKRKIITTGVAQSTTLDPWGTYVLDTSGVYEVNPTRGSLCTIHIHSTAKILFKGSSEVDAVRFPSSKRRVLKVWCTTALSLRNQPGFQIFGFTTHRAYIRVLAPVSSDLSNESLIAIGWSTTT